MWVLIVGIVLVSVLVYAVATGTKTHDEKLLYVTLADKKVSLDTAYAYLEKVTKCETPTPLTAVTDDQLPSVYHEASEVSITGVTTLANDKSVQDAFNLISQQLNTLDVNQLNGLCPANPQPSNPPAETTCTPQNCPAQSCNGNVYTEKTCTENICVASKTETCTNGCDTTTNTCATSSTGDGTGSGCFIADVQVLMANGQVKPIQDIQVGELVQGSTMINTVEKPYVISHFEGYIYGFNELEPFFTDSHPFMSTDGWKAINPDSAKRENPGLEVSKLEVGDTLILKNSLVKIEKISSNWQKQPVYNLELTGTMDFYANGFLVHNTDNDKK